MDQHDEAFGADLAKSLDHLVLKYSDASFDEFERQLREIETNLGQRVSSRSDLSLELKRRLAERRLYFWLERPASAGLAKAMLLRRSVLGYNSTWEEANLCLAVCGYLTRNQDAEEGMTIAAGLLSRLLAHRGSEGASNLEPLIAKCEALLRET